MDELRLKIEIGVNDAKVEHVRAAEMKGSDIEVSVAALTLEIWQGAEKLWPDVEALYEKLRGSCS